MFESLSEKISKAIKKVSGNATITESNILDMVREIRIALLEADVNYKIVKDFTNNIKEKALGLEVRNKLNPSEEFLNLVYEELISVLGSEEVSLNITNSLSMMMLVGLQGSGKTTTVSKIASYIMKKMNKKVLVIAADIYRMAAIEQLKQLGKENNFEVFSYDSRDVVEIVKMGKDYALSNNFDVVLIDTAGRLHIDEDLMDELKNINNNFKLNEILLVVDAMIGQDAINVINKFNEDLPLTGAIVTKLDGNTKGGVALSIKYLTNIPIKFIGTSEKISGLDLFDPKRMAGRIIGNGDLLSLAEQIQDKIDIEDNKDLEKKLKNGKFDLEDFLLQMKQMKKLGPLENLLKLIPGASKLGLNNVNIDPKQLLHIEAIILSMTKKERKNPNILKASHKIRIANGSGTKVEDINKLLKQFEQMKQMMKMFSNGNMKLPF